MAAAKRRQADVDDKAFDDLLSTWRARYLRLCVERPVPVKAGPMRSLSFAVRMCPLLCPRGQNYPPRASTKTRSHSRRGLRIQLSRGYPSEIR